MLALTVMLSMKLIGFLMLSVRHEALSQILGLLVLENGVFLGRPILVPGMPLLIEIVILFDLLVIVACFGVLVRYLLSHVGDYEFPQAQAIGGIMNADRTFALATALAPAVAIVAILLLERPRAAQTLNLIASALSLASILAILLSAPRRAGRVLGWIRRHR